MQKQSERAPNTPPRERIIERGWGAAEAASMLEDEAEDPFYPDGRFWPES